MCDAVWTVFVKVFEGVRRCEGEGVLGTTFSTSVKIPTIFSLLCGVNANLNVNMYM